MTGAAQVPADPAPRTLDIRFTGSGSEYFRIWAVNLLLILLTCGLYLPFAKMRRIRYVYANTLIDGEPLAFHGEAWRMFRGFVLLAVLLVAYTLASELSPTVALAAFIALCAVWPALWRAAMQFRLGNTSWRGLRFGFEGSLRDAYLAHLPVYIPMAVLTALVPDGKGPSGDPGLNGLFWFWGMILLLGLMAPWSTALIKRYQHQGYRIAGECSGIVLRTQSVYHVGFKTALLGVGLLLVAMMGSVVLGGILALVFTGEIDAKGNGSYYGIAFMGLLYLVCCGGALAYHASRMQDLVWSNTYSRSLQFRCEVNGLTTLTLKNWVLIVLTLGLYRPFAVMATTRLRLEAVRIETRTDPATWTATRAGLHTDASGDVAGDFFGMDVGL